jgi:hypothetical protein
MTRQWTEDMVNISPRFEWEEESRRLFNIGADWIDAHRDIKPVFGLISDRCAVIPLDVAACELLGALLQSYTAEQDDNKKTTVLFFVIHHVSKYRAAGSWAKYSAWSRDWKEQQRERDQQNEAWSHMHAGPKTVN